MFIVNYLSLSYMMGPLSRSKSRTYLHITLKNNIHSSHGKILMVKWDSASHGPTLILMPGKGSQAVKIEKLDCS